MKAKLLITLSAATILYSVDVSSVAAQGWRHRRHIHHQNHDEYGSCGDPNARDYNNFTDYQPNPELQQNLNPVSPHTPYDNVVYPGYPIDNEPVVYINSQPAQPSYEFVHYPNHSVHRHHRHHHHRHCRNCNRRLHWCSRCGRYH